MLIDYASITPELKVAFAACVLLVVDLGFRGRARVVSGYLALAGLGGALLDVFGLSGSLPRATLSGQFVLDGFSLLLKGFFLVVGIVVVLLSIEYMRGHRYEGEYYFLVLCSVLGTMLMPSSRSLLMLFLSLELVSVPAFVLAGLRKQDPRSNEASIKFFIFGVLSAGLFVYGISLVYGLTGTIELPAIADAVGRGVPEPALVLGLMFIVAAFGFKVSAVPFQFWAPDTYEGSPTPLAAFLSVASKAAGFAGLVVLLLIGFAPIAGSWGPLVAGLAAATMTVGNVMALRQKHLVRLLGYSSIAQAGYMLIPIALLGPGAVNAGVNRTAVVGLMVYLMIYAAMNLGAFAVAIGMWKQYPTLLIRDTAGLARRSPFIAVAMASFLLSLGGIPPFAGWAAKFFVFVSAVNAGSRTGVVLAAIMVVNSVISLYYYVGVVRAMFLAPSEDTAAVRFPPIVTFVITLCLVAVVVGGILPETIAALGRTALIAGP